MNLATNDYAGLEPFRPPMTRATSADCLDLINMPLSSLLYHVLTTHLESTEKPRD